MQVQRDLQKLALVIDALPSIVAYVDQNRIYRLVNATFVEWFGVSQEEVVGKKLGEFLSDYQHGVIEPYLARALMGEAVNFETEIWYPKHGMTHVSVCYVPDTNFEGDTRGIVVLVNDISTRRAVEADLERHRKLLQTVTDNTASALFMLDRFGHTTFMNSAAHRMTEYFLDDLIARPLADVLIPAESEGRSELKSRVEDLARDQAIRPRIDANHFDFQSLKSFGMDSKPFTNHNELLKRKSGDVFAASYTLTPIFESGRYSGSVLEFQDISHVKELEQSLRAARDAAESASRGRMQFLANMSHEIRTPMNSILGFAALLKDPDLSERDRLDFTERVCSNGEQLLMLIDDILDLSKFEAGKFTFNLEPVDVRYMISQVTKSFQLAAAKKDIRLEVEEASTPLPIVVSDSARLRQIVTNLVSNAVKFTSHGQVVIRLRHSSVEGQAKIELEVEDSGIGIRAEDQCNLFKPFGQADGSIARSFGGTGLGLILSRRLAQALDGDIQLDWSEYRHGSRFRFEFRAPISELSEARETESRLARLQAAAHAPACPVHQPLRGRVLLAEDSIDNEALVGQYLRDEDVELVAVRNGFEVLDQFDEGKFDLILMDVQMPGMDGLTATSELRHRGVKNPILALSAHALPDEIDRSLQAGCDAHLTKPLSKSSLCQALMNYLGPADRPMHH